MPGRHGAMLSGQAILLAGTIGILEHRLISAGSPWLVAAVTTQVAALAWVILGRCALGLRAALTAAAATVTCLAILWHPAALQEITLALGGVFHAAAYAALLLWFAMSLRPGREPVVTGFARRIRRSMPADVVRYTRLVTMAWCIFFAAQLLGSLTLLLLAPAADWAAFVGVWNLPLVLAMMLAEYACRAILFRRQQRTGLLATLRNVRGMTGRMS